MTDTAEIVRLNNESVLEFVGRHRAGVFTNDVANRFVIHRADALVELRKLERAGVLVSFLETTGGDGSFFGRGRVWKVSRVLR